ncbi:MAG: hypothetical protein IKG40_03840 [Bacilli bacterium]|nr:hypothetical protein [Bacilli bacterium]
MNYYNPYFMMYPSAGPRLFGSIRNSLRGLNFSGILNGTQRTLNIINQAIPLVKQVRPVLRNAGTMFKVMNEFKKTDTHKNINSNYHNNYSNDENMEKYDEGPKFFL